MAEPTDDDIQQAFNRVKSSAPVEKEPSLLDPIKDTVKTGLSAIAGATGSLAKGARLDGAGDALINVSDYYRNDRSADKRIEAANAGLRMQNAEASGSEWERYKAMAKGVVEQPLDFAVEQVGNMLPTIAAGVATGGLGAAAVGALQSMGDTRRQIEDSIRKRALREGKGIDEADAMARAAGDYGGGNTDQIALSGLLGSAEGVLGVQRTLGKLGKASGRAELGGKYGVRQLGSQAAEEAIPELFQEGQQAFAGNLAQQRAGFDQDLMEGVASQAAFGATVGGVMGGGVGFLSHAVSKAPKAEPAPEQSWAAEIAAEQAAPAVDAPQQAVPEPEMLQTPIDPEQAIEEMMASEKPAEGPAAPEVGPTIEERTRSLVDETYKPAFTDRVFDLALKKSRDAGADEATARVEAIETVAKLMDRTIGEAAQASGGMTVEQVREQQSKALRQTLSERLDAKLGKEQPKLAPTPEAAQPSKRVAAPAEATRKAKGEMLTVLKELGRKHLTAQEFDKIAQPRLKAALIANGLSGEDTKSKAMRQAVYVEIGRRNKAVRVAAEGKQGITQAQPAQKIEGLSPVQNAKWEAASAKAAELRSSVHAEFKDGKITPEQKVARLDQIASELAKSKVKGSKAKFRKEAPAIKEEAPEKILRAAFNADDVEHAVSRGAKVNQKDVKGRTAMHGAAGPDVIHALIRSGADINAEDANGASPAHTLQTVEDVQALLEYPELNLFALDEEGKMPGEDGGKYGQDPKASEMLTNARGKLLAEAEANTMFAPSAEEATAKLEAAADEDVKPIEIPEAAPEAAAPAPKKRMRLRKMTGTVDVSESVSDAKAIRIAQALAKFPPSVSKKVQILSNPRELVSIRPEMHEALDGALRAGDRVSGMYEPDSDVIYLFADGLDSEKETIKTLSHEVLHRGIHFLLSKEDSQAFYAFMERLHSGNPLVRDLVKQGRKAGRFSATDPIDLQVEEALALAAEEPAIYLATERDQTMFTKAMDAVEHFLSELLKKIGVDVKLPSHGRELAFLLRRGISRGFDLDQKMGPRLTIADVDGELSSMPMFRKQGTAAEAKKADEFFSLPWAGQFGEVAKSFTLSAVGTNGRFGTMKGLPVLAPFTSNRTKAMSNPEFAQVYESLAKVDTAKQAVMMQMMSIMEGSVFDVAPANSGSLQDTFSGIGRNLGKALAGFGIKDRQAARNYLSDANLSPFWKLDERANNIKTDKAAVIAQAKKDGLNEKQAELAGRTYEGVMKAMQHAAELKVNAGYTAVLQGMGVSKTDIEALSALSLVDQAKRFEQLANKQISSAKSPEKVKRLTDDVELTQNFAKLILDGAERGYMPLARYGQYVVKLVDGETTTERRQFESKVDASRYADQLRKQGKNPIEETTSKESQGFVSHDYDKIIAALEEQAKTLDASGQSAVAETVREQLMEQIRASFASETERRLEERKGIKGFDSNYERAVGNHIIQTAQEVARSKHMRGVMESVFAIPNGQGKVKDEAIKLVKYVTDPSPEAPAFKGLLFINYIGGSMASAFLNLTQSYGVGVPVINAFKKGGPIGGTMGNMAKAMSEVLAGRSVRPEEAAFLRSMSDGGYLGSADVFELQNMAMNSLSNRFPRLAAGLQAWAGAFSGMENANRQATALAMFREIQRDPTIIDRISDRVGRKLTAEEATQYIIEEAHGVFSKLNRPAIARGAVGSTLMTFKQFPIMWLETFSRMPAMQKAQMLGVLMFLAGAGGLPFADDIADLADTLGEMLGYSLNSKQAAQQGLTSILKAGLGEEAGGVAGDYLFYGASQGLPLNFAGRMAMSNLLPSTAIFKPSEKDKVGQIWEITGVAGSYVKSVATGIAALGEGEGYKAAKALLPLGVSNAVDGVKIGMTGEYHNSKGELVKKFEGSEAVSAAVVKTIGFQPGAIAKYRQQDENFRQDQTQFKYFKDRLLDELANANISNEPEVKAKAMRKIIEWNKDHAGTIEVITAQSIQSGLRSRMKARQIQELDRRIKTATKAEKARLIEIKKSLEDKQ